MKRITKVTAFLLALVLALGCSMTAFASSAENTSTELPIETVAETSAELPTETVTEASAESETELTTEASAELPAETVTEASAESETERPTESETELATETITEPAVVTAAITEQSLYEQLMACETLEEMLDLLDKQEAEPSTPLTDAEREDFEGYLNRSLENGEWTEAYAEEKVASIIGILEGSESEATAYAGPGGGGNQGGGNQGGGNQGGGNQGGNTATDGTFDHIEVEVGAEVSVTIDGKTYTKTVSVATTDTFTLTATYNDEAHEITSGGSGVTVEGKTIRWDSVTKGNGASTSDGNVDTVELSGSFWTGTKSEPVYYTITVTKNVTFTLEDGSELTIPVTLTVTTNYWDPNNDCPPLNNNSRWSSGGFVSGAGIDVPVGGTATYENQGDLQITKKVEGLALTEDKIYTFNVYNSSDELVKTVDVTVGSSGTGVGYVSALSTGTYTVREVTEDGAIAVDGYTCKTTVSYGNDNTSATIESNRTTEVTVTNTYTPASQKLTITKEVTGNMGDTSKLFVFTVTSDKAMTAVSSTDTVNLNDTIDEGGLRASLQLYDDETVTITVPVGAIITITEINADGYETAYAVGDDQTDGNVYTINGITSDTDITVTNTKDATIDTGILLDAIPYVLILAVVAAGAVFLLARRRRNGEE